MTTLHDTMELTRIKPNEKMGEEILVDIDNEEVMETQQTLYDEESAKQKIVASDAERKRMIRNRGGFLHNGEPDESMCS